jgi:hypothetical protein
MAAEVESPGSTRSQFAAQVELRLSIVEPWIERMQIPWKTGPDGTELRDAKGELVPDFAPTKIYWFCNWLPEMSSPASGPDVQRLKSISRTTLGRDYHHALYTRADAATKALEALLIYQIETKNKVFIIKALEAKVEMLEKIVDAQQTESRRARLELGDVTTKYRKRHNESQRVIAQLKVDLDQEKKRVAELVSSKVLSLPLHRVVSEETAP